MEKHRFDVQVVEEDGPTFQILKDDDMADDREHEVGWRLGSLV